MTEVEEVLGVGVGRLFPEKLVEGEIEVTPPPEEISSDPFDTLEEGAGVGGYFKITPRASGLEETGSPPVEVPDTVFYMGVDLGEGAPLATIRRDDAIWGGSGAVAAVREAEAVVGGVAMTLASEATAVEEADNCWVLSPVLGEALLRWSDCLLAARRPMASFLAIQAIVMGGHQRAPSERAAQDALYRR